MLLISNRCFQLKYESSIYNISFSVEHGISSESGEKYALFINQPKTILNKYVDVRRLQGMGFFTGGRVIMNYGLKFQPEVTL